METRREERAWRLYRLEEGQGEHHSKCWARQPTCAELRSHRERSALFPKVQSREESLQIAYIGLSKDLSLIQATLQVSVC